MSLSAVLTDEMRCTMPFLADSGDSVQLDLQYDASEDGIDEGTFYAVLSMCSRTHSYYS